MTKDAFPERVTIPGMGTYSVEEIDNWPPAVRRVAADALRSQARGEENGRG